MIFSEFGLSRFRNKIFEDLLLGLKRVLGPFINFFRTLLAKILDAKDFIDIG